jgi:hypothetical protein
MANHAGGEHRENEFFHLPRPQVRGQKSHVDSVAKQKITYARGQVKF